MVWIGDHLGHHGLHDCYIAVEGAANQARKQRNPIALCHSEHQARERDAAQADQGNGLSSIDVGYGAPSHGRHGLCHGVGGDQKPRVEGRLVLRHTEILDHDIAVCQNGIEGEGLRESTDA